MHAAALVADADLLVVKVGSSLVAGGAPFSADGLARDLAERRGPSVLVSSGAVALGRAVRPDLAEQGLAGQQALSAIGQLRLMRMWEAALGGQGRACAQVLLTPDVTDDRARYLNARAALRALLQGGVVPVVNENDAVATDEIRYGDNDGLAARVAGLAGADVLLLLSDVDGLYTAPPDQAGAAHIPHVAAADARGAAAYAGEGGTGTGGMRSKIEAARLASSWGVPCVIASGRTARPLAALGSSARSTLFAPDRAAPARRRWLAGTKVRAGAVEIDEGAARALRDRASLLAVGVTRIVTPFRRGEVVEARRQGVGVAYGLAACDADAVERGEAKIVLHRDDLVVDAGDD